MSDVVSQAEPVFRLRASGSVAQGYRTANGFMVLGGAVGRGNTVPSFENHSYNNLRATLLQQGIVILDGSRLVLPNDFEFSSPSAAAGVLLGRTANGNIEWRDDDGRTLADHEGTGEPQTGQVDPEEQAFRRRWHEAHGARFDSDQLEHQQARERIDGFTASAPEAQGLLAELRRTGDLISFHDGMKRWSVKPGTLAFNGFSGQMMLNQLVKRTDSPGEVARLLADCLSAPTGMAAATAKLRAMVDYVESIRVGAHPAPGHVPFLLSYFWGMADHQQWPVLWASAAAYVEFVAGEPLPADPVDRYAAFMERVAELTTDHAELEMVAAWWQSTRAVTVDEVLTDRCGVAIDTTGSTRRQRDANNRALAAVASYWANQLTDEVSAAIGRSLSPDRAPAVGTDDPIASPFVVTLLPTPATGVGFQVRLNRRGLAIGIGVAGPKPHDRARAVLTGATFHRCRLLTTAELAGDSGSSMGSPAGELVYGRWFERDELAAVDLRQETTAVAATLQPLFDELLALTGTGTADGPLADDPLEALVTEFRRQRGYPTKADEENQADRRRFAQLLAADAIALADIADLRQIWNTGRYGTPGPMPELNRSFRDASAAEYDRMIDALRHLCWGPGPDAERIDALLSDDSLRISGLGESVIMKLLATTHPDRYLAVFPYSGPKGKRRMLQLLGLEEPTGSRGTVQQESNTSIHHRLDRLFPGDAWGMTQFLYWYLEQDDEPDLVPDRDVLGELADELLVDREFLADIVSLLEDKGQVILYGPPGTGKTFLARRLAEVLAPDPASRALVQFHPSSSYEDFFEGYRPEAGVDGDLAYRLTPGPLALLAARAADAPGRRHLMIIDEINRANLPKVLGELLFLLEYRGESVRTLYRPEDAFQLPKDLWFIGTMNTADRSIALVDAALRRRFHFIPFFPNSGPMAGLLDRWLERNEAPAWVGELVAQVNDELDEALGGPHLQLGPSHFMKKHLDEQAVRRIWQYNIEPFIEDQFFGDRQQIDFFRYDAVYRRYQEQSGQLEKAELEAIAAEVQGRTGAAEADEPA